MAIYGEDLAHLEPDGVLSVVVRSSDETREVVVSIAANDGYPNTLPRISVAVNRGVKNEAAIGMQRKLDAEASELRGMPMAFGLAEKLKQLLDEGDEAAAGGGGGGGMAEKAEELREEEKKPLNHQVGEPLITTGTRCTENVFQEWREKWMEQRAVVLSERRKQQEREADGRPTGKVMFEAARDEDKAARQQLSQLIADENVDESLFK